MQKSQIRLEKRDSGQINQPFPGHSVSGEGKMNTNELRALKEPVFAELRHGTFDVSFHLQTNNSSRNYYLHFTGGKTEEARPDHIVGKTQRLKFFPDTSHPLPSVTHHHL